jgi:hypothetical protein
MTLPVILTPTYELIVPSTKQKVKYRPFLVKEQKALLIAQQSEDQGVMFSTLINIIKVCTFDKLDVKKLAMFDVEYIFTQLRARSVGEISELIFSCLECNEPLAKSKVQIDLTKLEVTFDPNHNSYIMLTDTVGIKMKYPGITEAKTLNDLTNIDINNIFDLAVSCIDSIYDDNGVYPASESTKEELNAFLDSLNQAQFEKIKEFFLTLPKLEKTIEFDCPVCKFHHKQTLRGLESFF